MTDNLPAISRVFSAIPTGFSGTIIEVEGSINHGLPAFNIVGMASKTVSEARERVRSALKSSNFSFPPQKITINLAPAELTKDGTGLDLSIAISILVLSRQLQPTDTTDRIFIGELSLSGEIRPVRGILNVLEAAKSAGKKEAIIPADNLPQATLLPNLKIIGVKNLKELFLHLKGQISIEPSIKNLPEKTPQPPISDPLSHIKGQDLAKRALTIAIAGRHNFLISGPPGAGKTLLAKTAAKLLPPLTTPEQIALTKLHSLTHSTSLITERPFRSPHHTSTISSIIGGGLKALPGEISLAHLGVLFLDELPEFPRHILEALRQPLEDRQICLARAHQKVIYPANFLLIAAMNPCPCGYLGDPDHPCNCSEHQIRTYQKHLSGPLLDRIDLTISVKRTAPKDLLTPQPTHPTTAVKNTKTDISTPSNTLNRIAIALKRQAARYDNEKLHNTKNPNSPEKFYNSSLSSYQITKFIPLEQPVKNLLNTAADRLNLSARAYFKVIKIARTIADLEDSDSITPAHLSEALSYRQLQS